MASRCLKYDMMHECLDISVPYNWVLMHMCEFINIDEELAVNFCNFFSLYFVLWFRMRFFCCCCCWWLNKVPRISKHINLVTMYPFKQTFKTIDGSQNMSQLNNPMMDEGQWPNQAAYQHIDLDTVDWAALAQQWIHMKETCVQDDTVDLVPPPPPNISIWEAPPPPNISRRLPLNEMEEKGEAPMEVEREDEITIPTFPPPPIFSATPSRPTGRYPWGPPRPPDKALADEKQQMSRHHRSERSRSPPPHSLSNEQNDPRLWYKRSHNHSEFCLVDWFSWIYWLLSIICHCIGYWYFALIVCAHTEQPGWNYWRNPRLHQQKGGPPPNNRSPHLNGPYVQYPPVYNRNEPGMWPPANGPFPANDTIEAANAYANQLDTQSKSGIDINIDNMPAPCLDAAQRKSLPAWIR